MNPVARSDPGGVPAKTAPDAEPRRWWILLVLCLSLFMIIMGNTVLNIALPKMSSELKATGSDLQWVVDAYALVFAGLLFSAGAIGDRFGRKGALSGGLVLFGLGSAAATFADSARMVTGCRALMGLGAAFVMPATLSILLQVFPPHERTKAIGAWAGVAGAAGAVGPIASGWLLDRYYWGSVFWINVPVVILALAGGRLLVPTSRERTPAPLDPLGAILSIGMIVSLVYGIIEAPTYGWTDPLIVGSFVAAAALLGAFVARELRAAHPMLDVRLFRERGFTGGSLAMSMVFFGMFGMFFLISQYLQMVLGHSALATGVRTLPFAAVMMVASPGSAGLSARFGTRAVVSAGLAVSGSGLLLMAHNARSGGPYWPLALSFGIIALGMSLTMAPATATIMEALPPAKAGVGSAMNDTTRELGGALGVAVFGTLFASTYGDSVREVAAGLPPEIAEPVGRSLGETLQVAGALGARAPEVIRAAQEGFVDGMSAALGVGAVIAFVGAVTALAVLPRRRQADDVPAAVEVEPVAT